MKKRKNFFRLIFAVILTLGLSISVQYIFAAWQGPTDTPPNNNVSAPIFNDGTAADPVVDSDLGVTRDFYLAGDIKESSTIKKDASGNVIIQLGN